MLKLIAVLLGIGGIAGIVTSLRPYITLLSHSGMRPSATLALLGLLLLAFGWSTWTGVNLWRGRPGALKWAKVLFALQILHLSTPSFAYQFYTGLMFDLYYQADSKLGLEFQLGSLVSLHIAPETENLVLGLNVAAIVILVYLMDVSRQMSSLDAAASGEQFATKSKRSEY